MKFREFSKNLTVEIENLFATLGDSCLPEDAHRLDQTVNINDILEKVKNLNLQDDSAPKSPKSLS
jgi:hypothetical protein